MKKIVGIDNLAKDQNIMNKLKETKTTSLNDLYKQAGYTKKDKKRVRNLVEYYDLVQEIRLKRLALGLSQEELASRAGVTRPELSKIENGKRNTTIQTLLNLAGAMGSTLRIHLT